MKKFLLPLLLITLLFSTTNIDIAKAERNLPDSAYNIDGKIKLYSSWYGRDNLVMTAEIWKINFENLKQTFYGADEKIVAGTVTYPNYNEMTIGKFDLQWVFTPDDSEIYETKSGVFHFTIYPPDTEESKGKLPTDNSTDLEVFPTLTATSLMLISTDVSYDVNINNKVSDSTYSWKSNNTKVAKVNKSGVITPVSEGATVITCDITLPDNTVSTLTTEVIVGSDDDNSPTLSDQNLTLEVGEVFDVDIENNIKNSKVKFVSSDKAIIKITSTTGKITALKSGETTIICTITCKDGKVIVLSTDITVE